MNGSRCFSSCLLLCCIKMGDAIIENVWDGEEDVDLTRVVHSDEEIDSEDEEVQQQKVDKKKRKFEAMKEKKRAALDSSNHENEVTKKQMSASQMLESILTNKPSNVNNNGEFQESDFYHPELVEAGTMVSTKHAVCPFVRALSVGLPTYKKLILDIADVPSDRFGSPVVLVVCASAQRASEIIKSMSAKLIKCKIAKLYAKHFKVQEQIDMLSKEYYPVAIGTPNRLSKLIELGSLSLRHTRVALIDITLDSKKYNILTLHEIKEDFYRLLYTDLFKHKQHLKLALINQPTIASSNGNNQSSDGGDSKGSSGNGKNNANNAEYYKKRKLLAKKL